MSTRCNIVVKDADHTLTFYRHCDGYPEGVAATLNTFIFLAEQGRIRDNVFQSSGWLILLGNQDEGYQSSIDRLLDTEDHFAWKVGAYEPTDCIHWDIEYLYELDLESKTARGWTHDGRKKGAEITIPSGFGPFAKAIQPLVHQAIPGLSA